MYSIIANIKTILTEHITMAERWPLVAVALTASVTFLATDARSEFTLGLSALGAIDNVDPSVVVVEAPADSVNETDLLNLTLLILDMWSDSLDLKVLGSLPSQPTVRLDSLRVLQGEQVVEFMLSPGQWTLTIDVRDAFGNLAPIEPLPVVSLPVSAVKNQTEPSAYILSSPWPNPFNPTCRFQFTLPHYGEVQWRLFNISGQCITTRKLGVLAAGIHEELVDASSLPSGLYFLDLIWTTEHHQAKLVVLK